ncbi:helix-hairpin-helix domain-containing protein [Arthrobacter zhangbolii]|uniref:Helix-hairpin-helix domain-containing protein n=1 Tax=Arthrobacter zhangbolii TaxID=2886936 RepID=A0A9X1S7C5_9MICC|nr:MULTISPECIES: helix-hairpin-helix domain-containing protein [Arthrobacter]MCC3271405.1 helix-hairpin-helix domain-containing protein [Arthrobacter zhangbolii]MCC3293315.1 helix-hairpin-helix domain-containing protein [Arthrobacter zhangbolii]MDN3904476.1 helix-hairpin-helix domain-containing protein [Arthrobacter sp. YD2]UON90817.1 helix-hairpin-helix domain-containing protein [Arthrobacter zhangbolii]
MAQHRWDTAGTADTGQDESPDPPGFRRRWALSLPAAVLAVCLLLGCAAAAVLLRDTGPAPIASVELSAPASTAPADAEGAAGTGTAGSTRPASPVPSPEAAEADPGPATVVVHIAGAVQRPGIVRLPPGSRIVDAVDAAGGTAADADLTAVNLAAPAQDGAMVLVPRIGEEAPPPAGANGDTGGGTGGGAAAGGSPTGPDAGSAAKVNLNTADAAELETLPRVGPVLAERIIAWRTEHGSFSRPEDLDAVPGIGEAMMAALLPLVTV